MIIVMLISAKLMVEKIMKNSICENMLLPKDLEPFILNISRNTFEKNPQWLIN